MAYQKTAKDLAWDRERTKLQGEIQKWQKACMCKAETAECYKKKCGELEERIEALELAIIELTKGEMTPDEAVKHMRKQTEAADMWNLITKRSSLLGGGYF